MKVVHVNLSDAKGGAAIACTRLHQGLLEIGIDSNLLVYSVVNEKDFRIHSLTSGISFQKQRVLLKLTNILSKLQKDPQAFHCSPNLFSTPLLKRLRELKPDVVHLHWVGGNILPIEALAKIPFPIVWTHHDMWPFCGAEHYSYDKRWLNGYTPQTRDPSASGIDWNRITWLRKHRSWQDISIIHIGPSEWIRDCAAKSKLWNNSKKSFFRVIPNGLDTNTFCPYDKLECRKELGVNPAIPILLFGAFSMSSSIKGGDLLLKTLFALKNEGFSYQVVTFGGGDFEAPEGLEYTNYGFVENPTQLAKLYSAADVMLVPSRLESFGQTASEAQACGTLVACFDTSGLKDIVVHQLTGYRAKAYDIDSYVTGIKWCLDQAKSETFSSQARSSAVNKFELKTVASAYRRIYEEKISCYHAKA